MHKETGEIKELAEILKMDIKEQEAWQEMQLPLTAKQKKRGKVGRNEPCPCGSGKKFKKCCILIAKEKIDKLLDERKE